MNLLDAVIAVPIIYGAYKGFQKGLIYEIAMIAGLVVGVYLAFKFSGLLHGMLTNILPDEGHLLHLISFLVVLGTILLIFILYARVMEAVLKITSLNLFNKIAGAMLGIFKFALAVSVIFWLLKPLESFVKIIPQKTRNESMLYDYILKTASFISPVVQDVKEEFRENFGSHDVSFFSGTKRK